MYASMRIAIGRVDDNRAVMPHRLLQSMRVPPIGARLADGEFVAEALPRFDRRHGHARHSVHQEGQQQAMPVDRGPHRAVVEQVYDKALAFAQPHQRAGDRSVHGHGRAMTTAGGKAGIIYRHGQVFTGKHVASLAGQRPAMAAACPCRHCLAKPDQAGCSSAGSEEFVAIYGEWVAVHTSIYAKSFSTPQKVSNFSRRRSRAR